MQRKTEHFTGAYPEVGAALEFGDRSPHWGLGAPFQRESPW